MIFSRAVGCGSRFCTRIMETKNPGQSIFRQLQSTRIQSTLLINSRCFATSEEKKKQTSGPRKPFQANTLSWTTFGICFAIGSVAVYVLRSIKKKKDDQITEMMAKENRGIGKALIGGPWELVNYDGKLVSWRDYLGKWVIIYFGFTHCPDICPEELEKLVNVLENLKKQPNMPKIYPLFFTVDPYRDTPENIKQYCLEYSPELVGFSGTVEQVAKVCKMFRVYFSEGPKTENDYIVDHSIVMYLINPDGEFVEHYTRETAEKRMEIKVRKRIQEYETNK